jgi:hypothetical protein
MKKKRTPHPHILRLSIKGRSKGNELHIIEETFWRMQIQQIPSPVCAIKRISGTLPFVAMHQTGPASQTKLLKLPKFKRGIRHKGIY